MKGTVCWDFIMCRTIFKTEMKPICLFLVSLFFFPVILMKGNCLRMWNSFL